MNLLIHFVEIKFHSLKILFPQVKLGEIVAFQMFSLIRLGSHDDDEWRGQINIKFA